MMNDSTSKLFIILHAMLNSKTGHANSAVAADVTNECDDEHDIADSWKLFEGEEFHLSRSLCGYGTVQFSLNSAKKKNRNAMKTNSTLL